MVNSETSFKLLSDQNSWRSRWHERVTMVVMEVENISGVEHPCPEPGAGSLSQNHPLACVALQCKWHAAWNYIEWIDMTIFTCIHSNAFSCSSNFRTGFWHICQKMIEHKWYKWDPRLALPSSLSLAIDQWFCDRQKCWLRIESIQTALFCNTALEDHTVARKNKILHKSKSKWSKFFRL